MIALKKGPFILSLNATKEQKHNNKCITDSIMKFVISWIINRSFSILSIWATCNNLKYIDLFISLIKCKNFVEGFFLHLSANSLLINNLLKFFKFLNQNNILFTLIRIDEDYKLANLLLKYKNIILFIITDTRLVSISKVIQIQFLIPIKILDDSYRQVINNQNIFYCKNDFMQNNIYISKVNIEDLIKPKIKISQSLMKKIENYKLF